jgi:hypothetical protein
MLEGFNDQSLRSSQEMIFDPKRHAYIDSGRIVPASEIRDEIENYITSEKSEVSRQKALLIAGAITIAEFFNFMREKIAIWHAVAGQIGYGGAAQMNPERWLRINEKIQSELKYLDAFQVATEQGYKRSVQVAAEIARSIEANASVPAGLETVVEERALEAIMASDAAGRDAAIASAIKDSLADSIGEEAADVTRETLASVSEAPWDEMLWGSLESRGQMYADSAYATYQNSERARESDAGVLRAKRICADDDASCDECVSAATNDYISLDEVLDIGDATCLSNCRCTIEFEYAGIDEINIDRELYA